MGRSRAITSKDSPTTLPRLTFPRGSIVSNPQTAFYGDLGGPAGVNPMGGPSSPRFPGYGSGANSTAGALTAVQPQAPASPRFPGYRPPVNQKPVQNAVMPLLNAAAPQLPPTPRTQHMGIPSAQAAGAAVPAHMGEGAVSQMVATAQYALDQGYLPRMMSAETINSLANKLDPTTLNKLYTFQNGMYYLNPDQTQYAEPGTSPNSVGGSPTGDQGAALAPGERGRTSWGGYLIGGEPTTKDQGSTPAGTAQYAQISNNIKGNHWRVVVQQDANGSWVRKTIADRGWSRRPSHQLRGRGAANAARAAAQNNNTNAGGGIGLVNFNTSTG